MNENSASNVSVTRSKDSSSVVALKCLLPFTYM